MFVIDNLLEDDDGISFDDESPSFMAFIHAKSKLSYLSRSRYSKQRGCRKSDMKIFEEDLKEKDDGTQWMNDAEFKKKIPDV